jgi:hypothetical protein
MLSWDLNVPSQQPHCVRVTLQPRWVLFFPSSFIAAFFAYRDLHPDKIGSWEDIQEGVTNNNSCKFSPGNSTSVPHAAADVSRGHPAGAAPNWARR